MTPAEMVGSLHRRGVDLVPAGDGRLRYRPRKALSEAERAVLARHRDAILALFDADPTGWRAAVMAAQVPRSGAIPLLLARPGLRFPTRVVLLVWRSAARRPVLLRPLRGGHRQRPRSRPGCRYPGVGRPRDRHHP
jgi:hypothetical protein